MRSAGKAAAKSEKSEIACPICGKPKVEAYRPFCSKRCADVDLGRWLNGQYAIPVSEDDDEDGENAADLAKQLAEAERKSGEGGA